jgi:hypothetical protein
MGESQRCETHGDRCAKSMCEAAKTLCDLIDRVGVDETIRRLNTAAHERDREGHGSPTATSG